jgi:hypothetical protein
VTSYRFSIDPKERKVGRFLGKVRRELQRAFEEEKSDRRLTQAEIGRLLHVDRSVINRQLMGTENMTLRRVAEFAWVLGRDLHFSLKKPVAPIGTNSATKEIPLNANVPASVMRGSVGHATASGSNVSTSNNVPSSVRFAVKTAG